MKEVQCVLQICAKHVVDGEGSIGMYGTIRMGGVIKVFNALFEKDNVHNNMQEPVCFHDVGVGIGNALACAWMLYGVQCLSGIEIDHIKV